MLFSDFYDIVGFMRKRDVEEKLSNIMGEMRATERRDSMLHGMNGGGNGKHESFKLLLCICPHKKTDRRMDGCLQLSIFTFS